MNDKTGIYWYKKLKKMMMSEPEGYNNGKVYVRSGFREVKKEDDKRKSK